VKILKCKLQNILKLISFILHFSICTFHLHFFNGLRDVLIADGIIWAVDLGWQIGSLYFSSFISALLNVSEK